MPWYHFGGSVSTHLLCFVPPSWSHVQAKCILWPDVTYPLEVVSLRWWWLAGIQGAIWLPSGNSYNFVYLGSSHSAIWQSMVEKWCLPHQWFVVTVGWKHSWTSLTGARDVFQLHPWGERRQRSYNRPNWYQWPLADLVMGAIGKTSSLTNLCNELRGTQVPSPTIWWFVKSAFYWQWRLLATDNFGGTYGWWNRCGTRLVYDCGPHRFHFDLTTTVLSNAKLPIPMFAKWICWLFYMVQCGYTGTLFPALAYACNGYCGRHSRRWTLHLHRYNGESLIAFYSIFSLQTAVLVFIYLLHWANVIPAPPQPSWSERPQRDTATSLHGCQVKRTKGGKGTGANCTILRL